MNRNEYFRKLPKVDILLKEEAVCALCERFGRDFMVECIREELDRTRSVIVRGTEKEIEEIIGNFMNNLKERAEEMEAFSLRKVWNGTGIILHTNLGRAPLGRKQMEAMMQAACGYSNLEYNLDEGIRGKRWKHYAELLKRVTKAEAAIAVNNNAASMTLIFSALAKGREVIVSRGEAIEIGGRFRIPEVVEQSGAILKEVGTTNRTRISDYECEITENTAALLKVHTSNYKVVGFTEEASLEELSELGKKYHLPVIMDLGSGVLVDLEKYGLRHEPTVLEMLEKGADLVCFSGDKLLGGPQAGIIAGKKELIDLLEHHPLMRAIRLDKCVIAALEATFKSYLDETRAICEIPVLRMITRTVEELQEQSQILRNALMSLDKVTKEEISSFAEILVEESISMVGGGSLPGEELPSCAVTIVPKKMSCEEMSKKMRRLSVPVITYMKNNKIWIDMRTIMPEEMDLFVSQMKQFFLADVCGNRTHPGRD